MATIFNSGDKNLGRKILILFALTVGFKPLKAQDVVFSADSVSKLLCNKWKANYAMVGNSRIDKKRGSAEINCHFNTNQTFIVTDKLGKEIQHGTWNYQTKDKQIVLTAGGKSNSVIMGLRENEFVMVLHSKDDIKSEPIPIKITYRLKTEE